MFVMKYTTATTATKTRLTTDIDGYHLKFTFWFELAYFEGVKMCSNYCSSGVAKIP